MLFRNFRFKHILFSRYFIKHQSLFNNFFDEFKVLKKVFITVMLNIDFHNKFIKFWIICLFNFSSYRWIYSFIYIYIYTGCDE